MSDSSRNMRECIATEAADWHARLRAENVSELDAARFRAWIAGDPARRREFDAIDAFWDDLCAIEKSPEVLRARASIAARRKADSPMHSEKMASAAGESAARGMGLRTSWAVAATILLAIGAYLFAQWPADADRYVTVVGEQRTVPLADGSVVTLNTATEIRVHYSHDRREVDLVSGEANFEVSKDATRPFVVSAGGGQVRAVGTVFDVYKSGGQVRVTLIEGKVAVRPTHSPSASQAMATGVASRPSADSHAETTHGAGAGSGEILLHAGEQLAYATDSASVKRVDADVQRVTAWRARKLDFSDTPLPEAIAEANRYSRDQIVLHAPGLESARISGIFEAGRSEIFVEGLQSYFRFNVERTDDHRIVLTVRD